MTIILGIKLPDKKNNSEKLQKILTEYNCIIKTRIGLNNSTIFCSQNGIILLQIEDYQKVLDIEKALLEICGIELQKMVF